MDTTDEVRTRFAEFRAQVDSLTRTEDPNVLAFEFLAELEELFTRVDFVNPLHLVGVKEMAELLSVSRTSVSNWDARRTDNHMPDPVAELGCGKVYDALRVMRWWSRWVPIKGAKSGKLPPGYGSL